MRKSLLAVLMTALLPACGSSTGPTMPPPTTLPPPPPCTQTILFQGGSPVPSRFLVRQGFSTSAAGRVDVILDWTFAANPIGVYVVAQGSCNIDQFNAGACNFLIRSESAAKPRRVSAPNVAAGNYELLVANFGAQDDSVSTQIIQSSSSCPPLAAVAIGAEARHPGISGKLRGMLRR